MFLKSMWEKLYCGYLHYLRKGGQIKDYWYENETFWFEGVKRGVVSYKPDFKVEHMNGVIEYIEIKGYETSQDRTKWRRMAKYHPDVRLRVVGKDFFKTNSPKLKVLIKEWE
jgi:enolase